MSIEENEIEKVKLEAALLIHGAKGREIAERKIQNTEDLHIVTL